MGLHLFVLLHQVTVDEGVLLAYFFVFVDKFDE